jgi:hypothetical protein
VDTVNRLLAYLPLPILGILAVGGAVLGVSQAPRMTPLRTVTAEVETASGRSYSAEYQFGPNDRGTVTYRQSPPRSMYVATPAAGGQGDLVVATGSRVYTCPYPRDGSPCVVRHQEPSTLSPFSSTFLLGVLKTVAAKFPPTPFTRETVDGQQSECFPYAVGQRPGASAAAKVCVTDSGIFALFEEADHYIDLTSITSSAPPSDFAVPGPPIESEAPTQSG